MKIKLQSGQKQFEIEELNYILSPGEIKELPEKYLRSYDIKAALITGKCRIEEGDVLLQIKMAKILFSSEFSNLCYGLEFEKFFMKNLDLDTISWLDKDDLPKGVYDKLMEVKYEEPKAPIKFEVPKIENVLDLNKDGVVDKKDAVIASKVLNTRKKKK